MTQSSFPIPGLNRTFVINTIPDLASLISSPCDWVPNYGISTKKREAARERRRWKKIHKKQGRH